MTDIIEEAEAEIRREDMLTPNSAWELIDALKTAQAENERLQRTIDNWRSFSGY